MRWRKSLAAALALTAISGCTAAADDAVPPPARPLRVVSINPCVDAVMMQVADRAQIAGISHYSQDPRATSLPLALARQFPATSGTVEEVVMLAPDLVIAGGHVAPATIAALARLKIPLIQIGVPATIAESQAQIATIAKAVGHANRGAALNNRISKAVRSASRPAIYPIPALIWQGGGLVPGDGTLAGELLAVSGYRNMSADYGLKSWDVLPLEHLVARPPRLLLSISAPAQTDRMLSHPVLSSLGAHITVRPFPERLLHCGGPTIIAALGHLSAIRRTL